jgi:hypothetical protein
MAFLSTSLSLLLCDNFSCRYAKSAQYSGSKGADDYASENYADDLGVGLGTMAQGWTATSVPSGMCTGPCRDNGLFHTLESGYARKKKSHVSEQQFSARIHLQINRMLLTGSISAYEVFQCPICIGQSDAEDGGS